MFGGFLKKQLKDVTLTKIWVLSTVPLSSISAYLVGLLSAICKLQYAIKINDYKIKLSANK